MTVRKCQLLQHCTDHCVWFRIICCDTFPSLLSQYQQKPGGAVFQPTGPPKLNTKDVARSFLDKSRL